MTISRETFDPAKNYKRIRYHQDRDLLDSELNEQQEISYFEHRKMWDLLIGNGFYMGDVPEPVAGNVVEVDGGAVYVDGHLEFVPGATLTYDPAKTSGVDVVYVELLKYNIDHTQDTALINPATGEPTAEREKWVLSYKATDTSGDDLPVNATARKVVPVLFFDRGSGEIMPVRVQQLNLPLEALQGMLPGDRITVGSITEDHLAFAAAEGLQSLLQNLAERTYDQAGSYLVDGFDSFIGDVDGDDVEVITNAGRAYIRGFRFHREWPGSTTVPKSVAVKEVRGEQKTFNDGQRRYQLNNGPLQATTQVEAIVEITANVTRGSVAGGEDLLTPNPVVDILEVSQGATVYQEGVDWQQSGNSVDWLGTGNAPAIGTTYTVRWTYTKQMVKSVDYVDGGWFGESGHPAPDTYYYVVTAFDGDGETVFDAGSIASIETAANTLNQLAWLPVDGALGYNVYRATDPGDRTYFHRLIQLGPEAISYVDDGVENRHGLGSAADFAHHAQHVLLHRGPGQHGPHQLWPHEPGRPAHQRLELQHRLQLLPRPARHHLRDDHGDQAARRRARGQPEAAGAPGRRAGPVQHRLPAQLDGTGGGGTSGSRASPWTRFTTSSRTSRRLKYNDAQVPDEQRPSEP